MPAPIRSGDGSGRLRLISSVAAAISLTARKVFNRSAATFAGLSWTQTAMTASPMYFCAQLPCRWVIWPLRKNQVPIVWLSSDSVRVRARGVKSRISTTMMVASEWVWSAVVGSLRESSGATARTASPREGFRNRSSWSPNTRRSLSWRTRGKLTRVPLTKDPLRLPRSTRASSPPSLRWIRACRRETDRLSSRTAHPSPLPIAQDWPSPSPNRRPEDSIRRYGLSAEGVTSLQCIKRGRRGSPKCGEDLDQRSQIALFVLEPMCNQRLDTSCRQAGTLSTKFILTFGIIQLNCPQECADR